MEWTLSSLIFLLLIQMSGASNANADIIGMAVAGCAGFVLFSVVVAIIAVSFAWTDWFNHWMRQRGQVRMPKSYFKKKEEIKRRLINGSVGSRTPSMVNGYLPAQSIDRGGPKAVSPSVVYNETNNRDNAIILQPGMDMNTHPTSKRTSWVQGWNQKQGPFSNKIYEEKNVTMELGEEIDDEYRIETEIVDNEHLDIGPFKNDHSKEIPIQGEIYSEPYLYSTVNEASKLRNSKKANGSAQVHVTANMEMVELNEEGKQDEDVTIRNFDDVLVHL